MDFIFKKRGHYPETHNLRMKRDRIFKPDKMQVVGKAVENGWIQEYRWLQQDRKQIEKLNNEIFNRFSNIVKQSGQHLS